MSKPLIILDVDGPLADFTGHILSATGSSLQPDQIVSPDVLSLLTSSERDKALKLLDDPNWWGTIPLSGDHAILDSIVGCLDEAGDLIIASSPWHSCPDWEGIRRKWLHHYFGLRARQFNSVPDKGAMAGDFFIDDSEKQIAAWVARNPDGVAYLFDVHGNSGTWRWPTILWDIAQRIAGNPTWRP